jgi:hypothetical protein
MKKYKYLFELLVSAVLSILIVQLYFNDTKVFEDMALGEETQRYLAADSGYPVHLVNIDEAERSMIEGWKKRGSRPVILNLGNSQTHSINQMKKGEVTYVELLHNRLKNENYDLLCNSLPNINIQEFLLLFEYWKTKLDIKAVVIPLFMDDLRETGIRDVFIENLRNTSFRLADSAFPIAKKINKELSSFSVTTNENADNDDDMKALHATVQERVELEFNAWLSKNTTVWDNRKNVRGDLFNWMYNFRNSLFGITASTRRKLMPSRYNDNMEALKAIIASAKRSGIKLLLYIPPIRKDVDLPYDETEYASFTREIETISVREQLEYKNLDAIIPGQYWGFKAATTVGGKKELDFMHFQFAGHKILADSLYPCIKKMIQQ